MTTAYKVVRRLEDGTLVSSFVDDPRQWPFVSRLTYEYGKVTMPHEDSTAGIFCYRTLEASVESKDISESVPYHAEVCEVYPVGDEIDDMWAKNAAVNYPAVLVGRKVADIDGGC